MLKREEKANPESCWNKAADNELVFVIRAHDITAPDVVRYWVSRRIDCGKNKFCDLEIQEAIAWAESVEALR